MDDYDNFSGSGSHFSKKTSDFRPRHKKDYNRKGIFCFNKFSETIIFLEQYDEDDEYDGNKYYDNYYNKIAKQNDYDDYDEEEDINNFYDKKDKKNVIYVKKEERKPIGFVRS